MLFSSMLFLWVFLPIVIAGYYLIHFLPISKENKILFKNSFLLLGSLIFYGSGGFAYLGCLFFVILVDFGAGFLVCGENEKKNRVFLTLAIISNLGLLFVFKYLNLVVRIIENLILFIQTGKFGEAFSNMLAMERTGSFSAYRDIVLPIGISFYIFQAISYVVDVYRKKVPVQKSIFNFALYVSFFPQLIAGPIVQYGDINEQLTERKESVPLFSQGITRFIFGLAKKVIIANTMGEIADKIWDNGVTGIGAYVAWLGAICYTLQIYYDFSGYSDMAIGLGKMFGFEFKENFNYPYISLSVQEFWRRWHISLSSWFRDYVYIPLGGSRVSKGKLYRNIFIVFLLTGVWHGANFTFITWGLGYAVLLILERMFLGDLLKKNPVKPVNWIYTMFITIIGWIIFRSTGITQAFTYIGQLFSKGDGMTPLVSLLSMRSVIILILGCILATPLYPWILSLAKKKEAEKPGKPYLISETVIQYAFLLICIVLLISETYNPFIYFQF